MWVSSQRLEYENSALGFGGTILGSSINMISILSDNTQKQKERMLFSFHIEGYFSVCVILESHRYRTEQKKTKTLQYQKAVELGLAITLPSYHCQFGLIYFKHSLYQIKNQQMRQRFGIQHSILTPKESKRASKATWVLKNPPHM